MPRLGIFRLGEWLPVIALGVVAVVLAVVGFEQCGPKLACHPDSIGDAVARSLFLIRGGESIDYKNDPALLVAAQTLMYGVVLWAAVKGSIKLAVRDFRHDVKLARARALRGHVVVCGLGKRGSRSSTASITRVTRWSRSRARMRRRRSPSATGWACRC